MSAWLVDTIGAAGAVLTTACWLPQAVTIVRRRDARALSLTAYAGLTLGLAAWLVYGLALADAPLIAASAIEFAIAATIVVLKLRHG